MTTIPKSAPVRFTGWHMLAILGAFFGVVIAVNLVMARFAPPPIGLMGKGVQSRHPEGSMVEMVPGPAHPDHPNPGGPEFPHGRLSPGARRRVDQALEEWRGLRQRQGDPQPEASCAVM